MFTARFDTIIKPVSERLINHEQLAYLNSDGFFQFVLMHEICHAVGPRAVKVGPKKGMATNAAIGPAYNALEEAKADIAGLMSLAWLMKEGVVDAKREKEFYVNYLGSLFRSARFGVSQAHGRAAVMSLHYLMDQGSIAFDAKSKRFSIVFDKFPEGVRSLSRELLLLLGNGDGDKVNTFFEKWVQTSPELDGALKAVSDLPTDVLPSYEINWGTAASE